MSTVPFNSQPTLHSSEMSFEFRQLLGPLTYPAIIGQDYEGRAVFDNVLGLPEVRLWPFV